MYAHYKLVQQGAVKTTKTHSTTYCLPNIWVTWEHYSGAIQGQTSLYQCTKITLSVKQQEQTPDEEAEVRTALCFASDA